MSSRSAVQKAVAALPSGVRLVPAEWEQRHRWIMRLLWLHVPIMVVFGLVTGNRAVHSLAEGLPTALLGVLATQQWIDRRTRAGLAGLGLMVSSAVLVHLSGGMTEMHFHFFVMLGVISLYQDWQPFLVSIAFVALHHGVTGVVAPSVVFDEGGGWDRPLAWAALHAFFVLCMAAVSITSWGIVEAGHRRSRAALEASESRFRALIEHSADVVTVFDLDATITYDSPSCSTVLGYALGERVGTNGFGFLHEDDLERAAEVLAQVAEHGGTAELEIRVRHRDGSFRWAETTVSNLLHEPEVAGFVANFRDVTARKALEDQLAHQAFHDPLTGLANRALMLDRIDHALTAVRRDPQRRLAVLYLDLDDFKSINDVYGHEAGDGLLREAAERITEVLRPGDTASRLGGDEFAVLLEDLPERDLAYEIGARLLEALQAPYEGHGESGEGLTVTASLGIALSTHGDDAASLLRNADLAMYRAKGEGKGRFEIYEAGMHALVVDRVALKADIRRAIDADEFEPHYQPIVDLASGRVTGVEALVRWRHPDRGLVSPGAFIPMAEETGLIIRIGSHVLHQACADAIRWRQEFGDDAPAHMSVNLSPRQIQDPGVVDDVADALIRSGLPPSALILEITESYLLADTDSAARTLDRLKALGVRIALDDFGTGYSSLTHLDRFPVDVLKIDKSFVDQLATEEGKRTSLVGAIVSLGMMLGIQITAEGIEGPEQLASLRAMGCELGQGFHFARPMDADALRGCIGAPMGTAATIG
jgi:diguanylate cyclase (GGDEF)-like protein/PAS domain S-box-containing protein